MLVGFAAHNEEERARPTRVMSEHARTHAEGTIHRRPASGDRRSERAARLLGNWTCPHYTTGGWGVASIVSNRHRVAICFIEHLERLLLGAAFPAGGRWTAAEVVI